MFLSWCLSTSNRRTAHSTHRAEELQGEFSGPQLSDIIVALGRLGYRPPAHVLDAFVHRISSRVHELPLGGTDELAEVRRTGVLQVRNCCKRMHGCYRLTMQGGCERMQWVWLGMLRFTVLAHSPPRSATVC